MSKTKESKKIITESTKGISLKATEIVEMLDVVVQANDINYTLGLPRITMCIWGSHGIGKTQLIEDYAKSNKMAFKKFDPSQLEEVGDLIGIPLITKDIYGNEMTTYAKPKFFPTSADDCENGGILLIDDFNRADTRILQAIMELLQKYKTVTGEMPAKWTIVASANPDDSDANYSVTTIDDAVMTRLVHCTYNFDIDTFLDWGKQPLVNKNKQPFDDRKLVLANNPTRTKIHPKISSYFNKFRNMIDGKQTSPRTIEMMSNIISLVDDWKQNINIVSRIAYGCLSEISASNFCSYIVENMNILDFKKFVNAKDDKEFNSILVEFGKTLEEEKEQEIAIMNVLLDNYYEYLLTNDKKFKTNPKPVENFLKILTSDIISKDIVDKYARLVIGNENNELVINKLLFNNEKGSLGQIVISKVYDFDKKYLSEDKGATSEV